MRFDIRKLHVACPICVDHAQLVVIAARAGKDDASDMFPGRHRTGCKRRQWSRQTSPGSIRACQVDRAGWDQYTKGYRADDQYQTDRQAKAPRGRLTTGEDASFVVHGRML